MASIIFMMREKEFLWLALSNLLTDIQNSPLAGFLYVLNHHENHKEIVIQCTDYHQSYCYMPVTEALCLPNSIHRRLIFSSD